MIISLKFISRKVKNAPPPPQKKTKKKQTNVDVASLKVQKKKNYLNEFGSGYIITFFKYFNVFSLH